MPKQKELFYGGDTAVDQFDSALKTITEKRGSNYGHPLDNFSRIAVLHSCVADCDHPAIRHALEQILVKVARLVQSPTHLDSVIDVAGYAKTIAMILDKEEQDG